MRDVCRGFILVLCVLFGSGCGVLMSVSEHERMREELRVSREKEREEWRMWREEEKKRVLEEKRALLKRIETLRVMRRASLEDREKILEEMGVKMKRVLDERDELKLRVEKFEREKKKKEESVIADKELVVVEEEERVSECGRRYNDLECYAVALLGKKYFYSMLADVFREREGVYLSRGDIEKRRRRVLKRKNRWVECDRFSVGYGGVELGEVTYFSNNNLVRFGLNGVRVEDKKFFELVSNNEDESGGWDVVVEKGLEICLSFRAAAGRSNEWDEDYGEWKKSRYVYAKPIEIWVKRGEQRVYKFSRRLVKKMVTPFKKTYYKDVYDKKRIYEVIDTGGIDMGGLVR